jgi:hypothetical protein
MRPTLPDAFAGEPTGAAAPRLAAAEAAAPTSTPANWKTGFEIELVAPPGSSRRDLAERIAARHGGTVRRFFHRQQEPSEVPGTPTFENLTVGLEALDRAARPLARFVDDVTLQADLDRTAPSKPGWYRILTDDARLVRLLVRQCDPDASREAVLAPIARLFGTALAHEDAGMVKVSDDGGASIAIAAPLPGERERACEIITPPLGAERDEVLGMLLATAREAGFRLPREGATHIHFDAGSLADAGVIATLVAVLSRHGAALKRLVGTNPNCIRVGTWPKELHTLLASPGFAALDWPAARKALARVGLKKYCDFNLANIATASSAKHTFEVRVLPASLDAAFIADAADLYAALLAWCVAHAGDPGRVPAEFADFLAALTLSRRARARWQVTSVDPSPFNRHRT